MDEHHQNKIANAFSEPQTLEQLKALLVTRLFEKWAIAATVDEREEIHATMRAARELAPILQAIADKDINENAD